MDDLLGNAFRGKELPEVAALNRAGEVLNELNRVSGRILQAEAEVALGISSKLSRNRHAIAGKVTAQAARVPRTKSDVNQAVLSRGRKCGRNQNILVVTHLEVGVVHLALRRFTLRQLVETQDVAKEIAGLRCVLDPERDVGDAQNWRPTHGRSRLRRSPQQD
jgi:hypothetical protein